MMPKCLLQDADSVCYDLKYALRLCAEHKLNRACVQIYSTMGLYEEAVDLALKVTHHLHLTYLMMSFMMYLMMY